MSESLRQSELLSPERQDRDKAVQLIRSFKDEVAQPMGNDERIAQWCRATLPELHKGGMLDPLMQEIFAFRRVRNSHFPPVYAMRLAQRAVQKQALEKLSHSVYPLYADSSAFWHYYYNQIFDPEEFFIDMCVNNNQANVPNRGKAFDLTTRFFSDRLGVSPSVVDVGASNNLVLKKWKAKAKFPFTPTKVVKPPHGEQYVGEAYEEINEDSQKINYLLEQEPTLGNGLGLDIFPINKDSVDANMWVLACSFYMSELLEQPERVQEFETLTAMDIPGVQYAARHNIDVRNDVSLAAIEKFIPGKVDVFTFSNILNQMTSDEIKKTFDNLKRYCHERTLFVVNEPARANPKVHNGLEFVHQNKWVIPYNYRTIIMEPLQPETQPYELFKWRTPRCNEVWLTSHGKKHLDNQFI
jgi:hypothetical protein